MVGEIATREPKLSGDFSKLMAWADKYRKLKVRTNADNPEDSKRARDLEPKGSAFVVPNTCSSKAIGLLPCGK